MSLIYDALNKTQSALESSDNGSKEQNDNQKPNENKNRLKILIPILIIAGAAFAWKYNTQLKDIIATSKIPSFSKNKKLSRQVKTTVKRISGFALNGIMVDSQKGNVAIINDNVMQTGDTFQGAKVIAINEKSVELLYEGEKLILSLD